MLLHPPIDDPLVNWVTQSVFAGISMAFAHLVTHGMGSWEILTAHEGSEPWADVRPANTAATAMNLIAENMVRLLVDWLSGWRDGR
jgi:hypothetical protein